MSRLFATPDIVKDFVTATGGIHPDPRRLLQNPKFDVAYSNWTGDELGAKRLRVLAVDLLGRSRVKTMRGGKKTSSATPRPTGESVPSRPASYSQAAKRDHSSSSSRSGQAPKRQETSTSSASSWADEVEREHAMEEGDVVTDVPPDQELEALAESTENLSLTPREPGKTDADAQPRRRNEKRVYDHLLYVHKGQVEREVLAKEMWKAILKVFNDKLMDLILESEAQPRCEWTGYAKGMGLFACQDATTKALFQKIIKDISIGPHTFRAWGKGEVGEREVVTTYLPPVLDTVKTDKLLRVIQVLNRLEGSARILSCSVARQGGRILRLSVDKDYLRNVASHSYRLHAGSTQVEFRRLGGTPS